MTNQKTPMEERILGLHHITAIAGNAQRNFDFYTKILGLRLVKKTVNFDDPETYHFYYGNESGEPGTILTFFPWENVRQGRLGTGLATEIGFSVPPGSFDFWVEHFHEKNIKHELPVEKFEETSMFFWDPDGLKIKLTAAMHPDLRQPWKTKYIHQENAIKGFHSVTLLLKDIAPTALILTDLFGYRLVNQDGNSYRYKSDAIETASYVDLTESPEEKPGLVAGGTNHHVAFRVKDQKTQMFFHDKILNHGLRITEQIDRNYFYSVYFREPGGVLFEIATDNPGFTVDEPLNELGTHLKLPEQYEEEREYLEKKLSVLNQS
jgi:glyoxalase family protein